MAITSSTIIQTEYGDFRVSYHDIDSKGYVSFVFGDIQSGTPVVRIHSACLFGEAFHSLHCDCNHQLSETMKAIVANGAGTIVYAHEEGRGIGLENKIKAMELERTTGCDTVEAFKKLGFEKSDYRNHGASVVVLNDLGISKTIKSFSGNPEKRRALESAGFSIVEELEIPSGILSDIASREKTVKKEKMGYTYKND